jgi:NAD dependent epimerase/dehydratase family enzyme
MLKRLATLPLPLPFGSFRNQRSLLGRDNLITAVQFVLDDAASIGETYLIADTAPVSLAAIIAALRQGFDRSPGLVNVPPSLIQLALRITGRESLWSRLSGDLIVDPKKLIAAGWRPASDTLAALAAMARSRHERE